LEHLGIPKTFWRIKFFLVGFRMTEIQVSNYLLLNFSIFLPKFWQTIAAHLFYTFIKISKQLKISNFCSTVYNLLKKGHACVM